MEYPARTHNGAHSPRQMDPITKQAILAEQFISFGETNSKRVSTSFLQYVNGPM